MSDYKNMNDHQLMDIKNGIEREQKRRAEGPKILSYRVTSCMTESMYFVNLNCALLAMREVSDLLISESIEDQGEYINKCTWIVGLVFRVEEMNKDHFELRSKEGYFHDWRYEDRLDELNKTTQPAVEVNKTISFGG